MERTVRDVMNPRLLYLREGDRVGVARRPILEFQVGAVPVLDDDHRPVGVVAVRDLLADPPRASVPAFSVRDTTAIEAAARALGEAGAHHAVVVDAAGRAVGMVSVIDLLRALVGLPVTHPAAFKEGHLGA
jgi:CBS-domain-containing membrane protein